MLQSGWQVVAVLLNADQTQGSDGRQMKCHLALMMSSGASVM
jgi:hypothetical protein